MEVLKINDNLTADNNLLQSEYEREKNLNRMFRRMAKQRANQNNGQPKKSGCGYVVVSSMQVKDHVWDDYVVDAWKTGLKTPYAAEFPLHTIYRDIRFDLIFEVLGSLGISRIQEHSKNGSYQIWYEDEDESKRPLNGIYRWCYRVNSRREWMEQVLSALIGAAGAIVVCVIQARATAQKQQAQFDKALSLIEYKIDELSARVEKHNKLVERTYRLEEATSLQEEKIKIVNHRLDDLERKGE